MVPSELLWDQCGKPEPFARDRLCCAPAQQAPHKKAGNAGLFATERALSTLVRRVYMKTSPRRTSEVRDELAHSARSQIDRFPTWLLRSPALRGAIRLARRLDSRKLA